ncbi:hypothetical protein JRQ81_009428 [Phrynocephalus forsythii]|uniref:Uncharacterized protein n=1 Tax=Phrynocephalus forsythii TaxID=171643 RepID=A0A9Q0XAA1_9SAUR|nr:hypothetical protein JRQ81_009428 [Phrynocephalus forsythii]
MPRAFLVKKSCVSTGQRNWSELPDEERGEIYVPVCLGGYALWKDPEPSVAEPPSHSMPLDMTMRSSTYTAAQPHCAAQVPNETQQDGDPGFLRPKIKRCSLESHLKKIHGVQQSYAYKERRAKLYVCEDCGATADSQDGHLRHLQERHPDSPLLRKASRKAGGALHSPTGGPSETVL